jgi:hypothetical protein
VTLEKDRVPELKDRVPELELFLARARDTNKRVPSQHVLSKSLSQ